MENFISYSAIPSVDPPIAVDSTHLATSLASLHPTTRGHVAIASRDDDDGGYLDARVAAGTHSIDHPQGTCAMGRVVDPSLRVRGVRGLYVADASVFPVVVGAHLQAAVYGLGEQAAVVIAGDGP